MSYIDPVFVEFARAMAPKWGVPLRLLLQSDRHSKAGSAAKAARYCTYRMMQDHGYAVKEIAAHAGVDKETVRYGLIRARDYDDLGFSDGGRPECAGDGMRSRALAGGGGDRIGGEEAHRP